MFIRKKRNKSGSYTVQVVNKIGRKNVILNTIGTTSNRDELKELRLRARSYISEQQGLLAIPYQDVDSLSMETFLDHLDLILDHGIESILGRIYDQIGFDQIGDELFRELVLNRLVYPSSKLKMLRHLEVIKGKKYSIKSVYRYMDKLHHSQKELVEQISYDHTVTEVLKGKPSILFYDVTTIYFEAEKEDELRIAGYSKEGKHRHPQILLGLLVCQGGYPMAYDIFEGNKYEGHTMLPIIDGFKQRFSLTDLVIIADSGLMSQSNLDSLIDGGYKFVLGARIKIESKTIKEQILGLSLTNGQVEVIEKEPHIKLLIAYSDKRAKKDTYNRERGLKRLEKDLKKGRLTKANINNRGYNKFLTLKGEINISINQERIDKDKKWDGLKGYVTNLQEEKHHLIDQYNHLWHIEKAFRISKTELRIRPIYHRLQNRIEAHICISFTAYKSYKELERLLEHSDSNLSVHRALEIIPNLINIKATNPLTGEKITRPYFKSDTIKSQYEILIKAVGASLS